MVKLHNTSIALAAVHCLRWPDDIARKAVLISNNNGVSASMNQVIIKLHLVGLSMWVRKLVWHKARVHSGHFQHQK